MPLFTITDGKRLRAMTTQLIQTTNASKRMIAVILFIPITALLLVSCSNKPSVRSNTANTLRSVDIQDKSTMQADVFVKPKTDEEINQAYANYLKNAKHNEKFRRDAITRLAELELDAINEALKQGLDEESDTGDGIDDQYQTRLTKTIELQLTLLQDYPNAADGDRIIYRLADLYHQREDYAQSTELLRRLIREYPESPFYSEAQFRLAEEAFSRRDYIGAENAYTEVLASTYNENFHEKALFKRGWSRYKQQFYPEAVDDYLEAVEHHDFGDYNLLKKNERNQFDEYFRAIGLSFANLGGVEALRDYFADWGDFAYHYYTYAALSDIYLIQQRYSDAADALKQYSRDNPNSAYIPNSRLKMIEIWQESGFTRKLHEAIELFYTEYNPSSPYWQSARTVNVNTSIEKAVAQLLKQYVVLAAQYHHERYQQAPGNDRFLATRLWYQRYLEHYSAYARQDNMYYLYAELLNQARWDEEAFSYYELAAYDGGIILDKQAAYATLVVSDRLYAARTGAEKDAWLNKHLEYVARYSELYPNDSRIENIVINASVLASSSQRYQKAIELTDLLPDNASDKTRYEADLIRAQGHFRQGDYSDAEAAYSDMLTADNLAARAKRQLQDGLAIAVYKQGEQARNNNDLALAAYNFARIGDLAPTSDLAATGLYDAMAVAVTGQFWSDAVYYGETFQQRYPRHPFNDDLNSKLAVAYKESNQIDKAADEFRKLFTASADRDKQMAALFQAAELYEANQEWRQAILAYRKYANTFKTDSPFPQYMEAMYKLTRLYTRTDEPQKVYFWQVKIRSAQQKTLASAKTDRTNYIAASALLGLAKEKHRVFARYRLVEPLKQNLRKKKRAMQDAIKLYGQASANGVAAITTESTHAIASLYRQFSIALLESERPRSLRGDQLEEYDILLEDQAFSFEDKAIEFYQTNLARTKEGIYNQWVQQSYQQLVELYPVKYGRKGKASHTLNALN